MQTKLTSLLITTLLSFNVMGAIDILSTSTQRFKPNRFTCARKGICSLKQFALTTYDKRITLPSDQRYQPFYSTDVRMRVKTKTLSTLTDYGVVQYIRGCMFESYLKDGKLIRMMNISRTHFGEGRTFNHSGWEIDSDSSDPVYTAWEDYGRFSLYRWNKNPRSLEPQGSTYYVRELPPHPTVFAPDMPGPASYTYNKYDQLWHAKNASLEFQTCLFKIADLPDLTDPTGSNIDKSKALKCFNWELKKVYNFKAKQFESSSKIDPFCQQQNESR
ncbi:MAG: hypothetical protein HN623_03070 [Bdellovibrionales bacterium]|nr:hypothetical protein [Bdellovibrionales bacterium]